MITILIPLSKRESLSFAFNFSNANQFHYHSHFGRQGIFILPCAFVQIRHLPPRITCQCACANLTIFGSVQIRWEIFFICANPTMNFPKNSSNHERGSIPVELTRICAKPTWIYLCKTDKIFVTSMRGCVIV